MLRNLQTTAHVLEPLLGNRRSPCREKPAHGNWGVAPTHRNQWWRPPGPKINSLKNNALIFFQLSSFLQPQWSLVTNSTETVGYLGCHLQSKLTAQLLNFLHEVRKRLNKEWDWEILDGDEPASWTPASVGYPLAVRWALVPPSEEAAQGASWPREISAGAECGWGYHIILPPGSCIQASSSVLRVR